jgi:hypothetical protein
MPFPPLNETGLHYERSGAGEALVLLNGSWVDGRLDAGALGIELGSLSACTRPDSYIEALEGFATGVAHG